MENLKEKIMDLMCEDDIDLNKIKEGLNTLNENGQFKDLSNIKIIFFEIAADLNNEEINVLLNEYTNGSYNYLLEFLKDNEYSPNNFLYNIDGTDALEFFLTSPALKKRYESYGYERYKFNQDFLKQYPVEDFAYLFLNYHFENFDDLSEEEIEFCEKFDETSDIIKKKYEEQCKIDFLKNMKENFSNYFINKENDVTDKTFVRMYREKEQSIVPPREIKSYGPSEKPALELGTWASTFADDRRYVSKWDMWQEYEMNIDYKFVSTFNIDKDCKILSVANRNELAMLCFLYPNKEKEITLDEAISLYNCAIGNIKCTFAPHYIDWNEIFKEYDVYYFANEEDIGEGVRISNAYNVETILVNNVSVIENLKEYAIDDYRKMFCQIEEVER